MEYKQFVSFAENTIEKFDIIKDMDYSRFISALVYLLQYMTEYKKAEELYEKALYIREKVLGEEHLDTAVIYNNLAASYKKQKEYKKTEGLYKKVYG